jgi:hypothetical protein
VFAVVRRVNKERWMDIVLAVATIVMSVLWVGCRLEVRYERDRADAINDML